MDYGSHGGGLGFENMLVSFRFLVEKTKPNNRKFKPSVSFASKVPGVDVWQLRAGTLAHVRAQGCYKPWSPRVHQLSLDSGRGLMCD